MGRNSDHSKYIEDLLKHPYKLGIDNVIMSASEVNLFKRGQMVAQPDLMFLDKYKNLFVVEYKCNDHRQQATAQLQVTETFLYDALGIPIKKIYAYGNNYHEEL